VILTWMMGYLQDEDEPAEAACPKSESRPVAKGEENGYPPMVWLLNCPLNKATGKPEITWFKAIQGNDSFYIVQVAFKAWPSKEQITQWMRYLKEVTVCDTRLPDRACAVPGAAQPQPLPGHISQMCSIEKEPFWSATPQTSLVRGKIVRAGASELS
jgi:hypothetical protein